MYRDRHGQQRVYLRVPGRAAIRLRAPVGTDQFRDEYREAMNSPGEMLRKQRRPQNDAKAWSLARLKEAVRETMADEGVYLLIRGGKVTYVGQSKNCARRIDSHRMNGRQFDRAHYIFIEGRQRVTLERLLIRQLAPVENKKDKGFANPTEGSDAD
jgi:hypothetical protein